MNIHIIKNLNNKFNTNITYNYIKSQTLTPSKQLSHFSIIINIFPF